MWLCGYVVMWFGDPHTKEREAECINRGVLVMRDCKLKLEDPKASVCTDSESKPKP